MKKNIQIVVFVFTLSVMFTSCFKGKDYEFKVYNNTNYRIDKISFSCCAEKNSVTIEPLNTSGVFNVHISKGAAGSFFTEPGICLTIEQYSEANTTYDDKVSNGGTSVKKLTKDEINIVKIEMNPDNSNSTGKFRVTINE